VVSAENLQPNGNLMKLCSGYTLKWRLKKEGLTDLKRFRMVI